MGFFYYDDSKHEKNGDFCLGAMLYFADAPDSAVDCAISSVGMRPGVDEFKSSTFMERNPRQRQLREKYWPILRPCSLGVTVTHSAGHLGPAGLQLLKKMLRHPSIIGSEHFAYFDEGLFSSDRQAHGLAITEETDPKLHYFFEQDLTTRQKRISQPAKLLWMVTTPS